MSSRNLRLSAEQRAIAPVLYRALCIAKEKIAAKHTFEEAKLASLNFLSEIPVLKLEYLEIAEANTLKPIEESFKGELAICIAAFLGDVRLIDNVVFRHD